MNKVKIVYATKTRHSKKIALALAKALNVQAEDVASKPNLGTADLLFIVGGIYGGTSLPSLIEFAENLDKENIQRVVFVTSSVQKTQGQGAVRKILEEKEIPVVDEIHCQGSFLFIKFGHPNNSDIKETIESSMKLINR
jgi:flavodoxin